MSDKFKTSGQHAAHTNVAQPQIVGGEQLQRPQRDAAAMSQYHTATQLNYISSTSPANGGVTRPYQPAKNNALNAATQAHQDACHPRGGFTKAGYRSYGSH